jgi:RNA-directed DNA polymerase
MRRSTADAGEQCFNVLAQKVSAEWVLEADIKGCFDNISHDWMTANIPTDKVVFKKWLKAGFVYQNELFPTDAGTPQGGIISPVAMNMTLDGLERMLVETFPRATQEHRKLNMVRYADDFIITGHSKEWLEQEVKPAVIQFLAIRGLELSPEKTKITHINDGFDFLGWNIRKYHGKLLMKPSKSNVKAHLDKMRGIIEANKTAKQENLIGLLNPVIRGWANYHRHVVAKVVFSYVDFQIWSKLWQWAVRRHPKKGAKWVKQRYFKSISTRNWVFAATVKKKDGTDKELILRRASDTPIQRHIKIKADANPHDPKWAEYFEARWGQQMSHSSKGRAKLYRVWSRQDCVCPTCHQPFTKNNWEIRFVVKEVDGGTSAMSNLQMYHPGCRSTWP